MSTASSRVLSTPELVDLVFSEIEDDSHQAIFARLALVCRLWAAVARDHIAWVVRHSNKLFDILAPSYTGKLLDIQHIPRPSQWQSFLSVSCRVRDLAVSVGRVSYCGGITSNTLDTIFHSRPTDIFPKLVRLDYMDCEPTPNPERLLLFLTPSLRVLDIIVPIQTTRYSWDAIFEDMVARCPTLESLALRPTDKECAPIDIQNGVCNILEHLPLQYLLIPPYYATTPVLTSAAKCKTLRALTTSLGTNECRERDYQYVQNSTAPDWLPHSYPNLEALALAAPVKWILDMLANESLPSAQLESLSLRAIQPEPNAIINDLFVALRTRCQELDHLSLILARPCEAVVAESASWPTLPRHEALRLETLQHIQFPLLTRLKIVHEYTLPLTDDDFVGLVANLPNLAELELNATPVHDKPGQPTLTLHVLHRIVPMLPELSMLALLVDATLHVGLDNAVVQPFEKLELLTLSESPISEASREPVTRYLGRILPAGVIFYEPEVGSWDCGLSNSEAVEEFREIWTQVECDVVEILRRDEDAMK